jgi:AcrR family transcriptional regulator
MPRPRFATLDPERRRTILAAAAEEFAQHGVDGASYNRIITRAGASKGAMYYYFDDKQDLLLAVLDDALARASAAIGGPAEVDDAAAYWSEIEALVTRALAFLAREPVLAGLAARMLAAASGPLAQAVAEFTRRISAATHQLLRRGQTVGAVRDDLPLALLTHLLTGLGEAMDRWLMPRWSELDAAELAALPARVVDLFTRIAAPHTPTAHRKQTLRTPKRGTKRP